MPSILFVCRANQFRSPIAASILKQKIKINGEPSDWQISSAGTWTKTGLPVPFDVINIANRMGITGISQHITRQVTAEILDPVDLIIVMEENQKEALRIEFVKKRSNIFMFSEIVENQFYNIPDPALPGVDPEAVINDIRTLIEKGYLRIIELAKTKSDKEG